MSHTDKKTPNPQHPPALLAQQKQPQLCWARRTPITEAGLGHRLSPVKTTHHLLLHLAKEVTSLGSGLCGSPASSGNHWGIFPFISKPPRALVGQENGVRKKRNLSSAVNLSETILTPLFLMFKQQRELSQHCCMLCSSQKVDSPSQWRLKYPGEFPLSPPFRTNSVIIDPRHGAESGGGRGGGRAWYFLTLISWNEKPSGCLCSRGWAIGVVTSTGSSWGTSFQLPSLPLPILCCKDQVVWLTV